MKATVKLIITVLCLLTLTHVYGRIPYQVDEEVGDKLLSGEYVDILVDTTGKFTVYDVVKLDEELWLNQNGKQVALIPNPNQIHWVRISLNSKDFVNGHWLLEIMDSHVDYIDAYVTDGDSLIDLGSMGIKLNFLSRKYSHKNFIFDIPTTDEVTFYFRYETDYYSALLFKVWKNHELLAYSDGEYYLLGVFYGILFVFLVSNCLFYFYTREKYYLYYIPVIISGILVGLTEDRTGFQYYWPDYPWLNYFVDELTPLLIMVSSILFVTYFLNIKEKFKKGWVLIWSTVVLNVLYYLIFSEQDEFLWNSPIYLLPFIITFILAFRTMEKDNLEKKVFLLGFSFLVIGVFIINARILGGVIFYSIAGVYAFNFSLIMKEFLLSMSLAIHMRSMKRDKERAQKKIIDQLRENEVIIENKVKERTTKIRQQNEIIEKNNQELETAYKQVKDQSLQLSLQSAEINRMNELLKGENEQLHEDVKELATARVLMEDVATSEFMEIFPDDESCYEYLADLKWKEGYICKKCDNTKYSKGTGPFARRCTKCGYNESATNGTIFHRLHFPIHKAFHMLFLLYNHNGEMTAIQLSELLDLRQNTCWKFRNKVKERLQNLVEDKQEGKQGWSQLILDKLT